MKKYSLFLLMSALCIGTAAGQPSLKDIEGAWSGVLKTIAGDLNLVLHFTMTEADTVSATLDSPDQGAKGIPCGRVSLEGDTVCIDIPVVKGQYKGIYEGDSLLLGTWSQLGRSYEMTLRRGVAPLTYNRPQESVPPYPYRVEEVTFHNAVEDFDLAGTLTLPEGNGPFPAVVLISGSGPQDRDETIYMHKPFLVVADHLTRNGIAVLRYDDRGTGKSKGRMNDATTLTLADDVEAAVTYLLLRPEIDRNKIGLAGHSEGGMIAPIVASRNSSISFIVSLAGPGVKGYDILLQQARDILPSTGASKEEVSETIATNSRLFKMAVEVQDQRQFVKDAMAWYGSELDKQGLGVEKRREKMTSFTQGLVSINNPWMRYFIDTDPSQFWSGVKCPVLALNGEKDLQVNCEMNLPAIKAAVMKGGNRKIKTVAIPGLNHLFQTAGKGSPDEYVKIEETFSPVALDLITGWIRKTLKMR